MLSTRLASRRLLGLRSLATMASSSPPSSTPVEDLIRARLAPLNPTRLTIINDSHLHAHHAAMADKVQTGETHFRLVITAEAFEAKRQPARHRMIYSLLDDEMKRDGGIHALQLQTMTPAEEAAKEEAKKKTTTDAVGCGKDH
ncbi:BolA domain UV induced protein Uvi31 [Sporothrix bragantina]|uniref:BolA domain UV induced protein Uvi31 n=1 Tax=Sporothrix bragantina TaxID=671064 RepID=A0ABP0CXQ0_9PEZI